MLFDSHAHLNDESFDEDREEVIASLKEKGLDYIVNPGADMETSKTAIELANKHDFIYAAVGVHPHDVENMTESDIELLRKYAIENEKVVAIGEIGLDYHYDLSPRELQKKWFKRQIELANELKLPFIVHDREAHGDTLKIMKEFPKVKGVVHCFSGSVEFAKECLKLGYYIGVTGVVTFKNSKVIKAVVKEVPLDRLLVETDCPYMAPTLNRGKRNQSDYIAFVLKEIATIKDKSIKEMEEITILNTKTLFRI